MRDFSPPSSCFERHTDERQAETQSRPSQVSEVSSSKMPFSRVICSLLPYQTER